MAEERIASGGYTLYAASHVDDGGIYKYSLSLEGRLTLTDFVSLERPSYFIKRGGILHTTLRAPRSLGGEGGYLAVSADLKSTGELHSTKGVGVCHLAVTAEGVYATNYASGSVTKIGGRCVEHKSTEHNCPGRQDKPHAHFVTETPDGRYLAVCDLGLDKIIVYDKELNFVSDVSVPDGAGVRHLVFNRAGDLAYTANELDSTTSVLRYADGRFTLIDTVSPEIAAEENYAAAVRLSADGDRLYVSQRGENAVSIYKVDGESLSLERTVSVHGNFPRDIALSPDGRFLVAANERSGSITVLDCERDYALTDSIALADALCVLVE